MKSLRQSIILILALASLQLECASAKKSASASSSRVARKPPSSSTRTSQVRDDRAAPVSRRRPKSAEDDDFYEEDVDEPLQEDEDDDDAGEYSAVLGDEDAEEDDDEDYSQQRRKPGPRASATRPATSRKAASSASYSGRASRSAAGPGSPAARKRQGASSRYDEDEYDEEEPRRPPRDSRGRSSESYRRGPPPGDRRGPPPPGDRRGSGGRGGRAGGGSVVPYGRGPPRNQASAFSSVIAGIRSAVPDTDAVRTAALSSIKAARETTSSISSNLYREVKGLTSSELEQVMLKATRPDDSPVKGKHVERLVGVTYQISARYDIYDAVLRKLWSKMAEKDWRTTIKALYILHRFSADGAPDHAPALKARLRELRRTRDPKRKDKFFNTKQLMAGDSTPENGKYRAFMQRYAHYVLLRAQCFGGMFDEIGTLPKADKKKGPKSITSTSLRPEHLEAAGLLLKAGVACQLKDGEECENTAIAAERVASDLIGLTTAVAIALNRALKDDDLKGADPALLKKWCQFYADELLPQTRAMVKKTSPKLDAYGLFLPSRMGTSVSRELLEKGLSLEEGASSSSETKRAEDKETADADAEDDSGNAGSTERAGEEAEPFSEPKDVDARESSTRTKTSSENTSELGSDKEAVDEGDEVDEEYEYEEEDYYDEEE